MSLLPSSARAEVISTVAELAAKRRASAFSKLGLAGCRIHVEAAVTALERDLELERRDAMREAVLPMLTELMPLGLSFSDLRFFTAKLRERVLESLAADAARPAVQQWFYDHLSVCTTHFMVKRDEILQRRAAQRDIERFESQLAELQVALDEKTDLLEMIRQASTPIAPVAKGILVVPLVGTFDRFRAELLTERLLDEIGRTKARAIILDISGVPVVDTDAAQLVIRLARSVRLIGARVILVGMSPANARTVVALDVDLSQLTTCATLQDGLARALAELDTKLRAAT